MDWSIVEKLLRRISEPVFTDEPGCSYAGEMSAREGVSFPSDSSTSAARTVMADALRKADPVGSRAIENETNWRRNYLAHFRRAVEAGVGEATAAHRIAADGLRSAHDLMRFGDLPLD